jgi:hypothetical protein
MIDPLPAWFIVARGPSPSRMPAGTSMTARPLLLTVIGAGPSLARCPRGWTADGHPASVAGADAHVLIAARAPEWPGALPRTVPVAQDGTIAWRDDGAVDGDKLRATILGVMGACDAP